MVLKGKGDAKKYLPFYSLLFPFGELYVAFGNKVSVKMCMHL